MTARRTMAVFAALAAFLSQADEFDTARSALRDGLWETARIHAARSENDGAKTLILESYAQEGRWEDLLKEMDAIGDIHGEEGACFKALALFKNGDASAAAALLDETSFTNASCVAAAAVVRAEIDLASGDAKGAAKRISSEAMAGAGPDVKAAAAELLALAGEKKRAQTLWRDAISAKDAGECAIASAALGLGDRASLEKAYGAVESAKLHRQVGLRLGLLFLGAKETFDEGERIVREISKDAPDTRGAKDAVAVLADALLERGSNEAAAELYSWIFLTWPEAATVSGIHEGHGWALRKLGRFKDAVDAFSRAEETATNDESRAAAILAQGDSLSEAGLGEEAMAKYRVLLEKFPDSDAGRRLKKIVELRELETKGRELYAQFNFAGAMKLFKELAAKSPSAKPRADYYEVLCLYGMRRDAEAQKKALEITSSGEDFAIRAEATLWLAKFSYNARKWKEAASLFSSFAAMRPDSPKTPAALLWAARALFAAGDGEAAVKTGAALTERYPDSRERAEVQIVQGEALIDLARFADAVLVLERAAATEGIAPEERVHAQMLKADALFAMGADNPTRYRDALDIYTAAALGSAGDPGTRLVASFKTARTLEKLNRRDEALDKLYSDVVVAYRENRANGVVYGDEACAAFVRAAFQLADEHESRGEDAQALKILSLVSTSDLPAAVEADNKIKRIHKKGRFL